MQLPILKRDRASRRRLEPTGACPAKGGGAPASPPDTLGHRYDSGSAQAEAATASNSPKAVHPWDALACEKKVATLKRLLTTQLQDTLPELVGGKAPTPAQ